MNTQTSFTDYLNSFTGKSKDKPTTQDHQVVAQVVQTKDYQQFNKAAGNRDVIQMHVQRLKTSMEKEYLMSPIIVNEKMEIIDGQHRFEAARQLELPIRFIKVRGYALSQMQQMNAMSRKWSIIDHIKAYADLGNSNYAAMLDFINKNKGARPTALLRISLSIGGIRLQNRVKNGGLVFGAEQIEFAQKTADTLKRISQYYDKAYHRCFIAAIKKLMKKADIFDMEVFIDRIKVNRGMLYDCANVAQTLQMIEDIYNKRSRNKVSLKYLSDD